MSAARLGQRLGQTNQPEIEARLELEGDRPVHENAAATGFLWCLQVRAVP